MIPLGIFNIVAWVLIAVLFYRLEGKGRAFLALWVVGFMFLPAIVSPEMEPAAWGISYASRMLAACISLIHLKMDSIAPNPFG